MPRTLARQTRRHFLLILIVPILLSILVTHKLDHYQSSLEWFLHTKQVQEEIDSVLLSVDRMDIKLRSYSNDYDERHIEEFEEARRASRQQISALRRLTADNPVQQKNVASIEILVKAKIELLAEALRERKNETIHPEPNPSLGKRLAVNEQIWGMARAMNREEGRLLAIRQAAFDSIRNQVFTLLLFGLIIIFGLLYWAFRTIMQFAERQDRAEHRLMELNTTLEQQVEERVRELNRTNFRLLRVNHDLARFAHVASHDLQEPLRTVSTFTSLFARHFEGLMDEEAKDYMAYIVSGSRRMSELITDLHKFTQLGERLRLEHIHLREIIDATLDAHKGLIDDSGARIEVYDPFPVVLVDRVKITTVVSNLLQNAIKFAKDGERPEIHIYMNPQCDTPCLAIQDHGIGFNPIYQDKIFEIFQRLHAGDTYKGTGLGLAISRRIVDLHGGKIWVNSQEGEGATFFFTMDYRECGQMMEEQHPSASKTTETLRTGSVPTDPTHA
jgi:signal transduction histidine kinase